MIEFIDKRGVFWITFHSLFDFKNILKKSSFWHTWVSKIFYILFYCTDVVYLIDSKKNRAESKIQVKKALFWKVSKKKKKEKICGQNIHISLLLAKFQTKEFMSLKNMFLLYQWSFGYFSSPLEISNILKVKELSFFPVDISFLIKHIKKSTEGLELLYTRSYFTQLQLNTMLIWSLSSPYKQQSHFTNLSPCHFTSIPHYNSQTCSFW